MSTRGHHQVLISYGGSRAISTIFDWPTDLGFPVLGANGNLYAEYSGDGGNKARRLNIDGGGTVAETYSSASWGFLPIRSRSTSSRGDMPDANIYCINYGGIVRLLDDLGDGTHYEYTGAPSILAASGPPCWVTSTFGYGSRDQALGYRLYKIILTDTSPPTKGGTCDEVILVDNAGSTSWDMFINGSAISGKVYYSYATTGNPTTISYINTSDDSRNDILTGGSFLFGGCLVGSDGYLYTIHSGNPATLKKRNASTGAEVASLDISNIGTVTPQALVEAANGYLWVQTIWDINFSSRMMQIDKDTMTRTGALSVGFGNMHFLGITEDLRGVFYQTLPAEYINTMAMG